MKKSIAVAILSLLFTSFALSACGGGEKSKIEVKDKIFSDDKEVNIETPAGDAHIDIPGGK